MRSELQTRVRLRPIDLARGHGLSTQAVRNYEDAGILPAAERTPHGYRAYTPLHAGALRAFLALVPGHGHRTAAAIMRAVNEGAVDEALHLVDESHVRLRDDRRTLEAVERALRDPDAAAGPGADARSGPAGRFIGRLAAELGVRAATLRAWERAGLVRPHRDARTGYRVYDEADVRDARLAHQLRRGGYLLEQIAPLIARVREADGTEPLEAALLDWRARVSALGRAMLSGAAELEAYLRERDRDRGREAGTAAERG
jgi:DNA-binding transcriptional MerR regulator